MKKLISVALAGTLALSLAACGSSASSSAAESTAPAESEAASTSEAASEESTDLAGTTLKVAASPTPHAEILNAAKFGTLEVLHNAVQLLRSKNHGARDKESSYIGCNWGYTQVFQQQADRKKSLYMARSSNYPKALLSRFG